MRLSMRWSENGERRFRPGTVVEVRSVDEILATLDEDGASAALPFMPEMLRFAGRRFTISKRADLSCDTIKSWKVPRRMRDAVHLEDLRCDGSAHAGCQAGCLLFWKESWLKPVDGPERHDAASEPAGRAAVPDLLSAKTLQAPNGQAGGSAVRYRCQATELVRATEPVRSLDLSRYLRELRSGNVTPVRLVTVMVRAGIRAVRIRLRLRAPVPLRGSCVGATPKVRLDLQPGERVRVRSRQEIAETLNANSKNRGLWFDWEMLPHCGRTYRVGRRVSRLVDERTGNLIEINSDNLILEGVACSGDHSSRRLFCTRAIYPYWREAWLERVDGEGAG